MHLRDVWKQWTERSPRAAAITEAAGGCTSTPSLLAELAVDPADFADLACVLGVDLDAVVATLIATRPATPDDLVARLRSRATHLVLVTTRGRVLRESWGGGGRDGGWEGWARTHGDGRAHRDAEERTARTVIAPAMVTP